MSYGPYNYTIVRSFKGDELTRDELMCDEYCDENPCENMTSLITLRRDKVKLF